MTTGCCKLGILCQIDFGALAGDLRPRVVAIVTHTVLCSLAFASRIAAQLQMLLQIWFAQETAQQQVIRTMRRNGTRD